MKIAKRLLAITASVCLSLTAVACGGADSSEDSSHEDQVQVEDTSKVDSLSDELSEEERTLIWLGTYNLNQADGNETRVETKLFNEKGGKIEWMKTTDDKKFDKLANAIAANKDVPDIFKYEWLAFPCQVTTKMYQPIDSIVDFDSDLWSDVKAGADKFVLNGEHYVAPISYSTGVLMMYDQDVVDNEGLADPYTLWMEGEWNWNTWRDVMEDYVSNATGDVERYGVAGWFMSQIIQQTGQTMINYDGTHFTSNIFNEDIERAENFIYEINKSGLVFTDWVDDAKAALNTKGNIMFYVMGPWALTGSHGPQEGDNWSIVPIPADPNTNAKITTSDMTAYMWVKGSTKDQTVKTWFECAHIANTEDQYLQAAKEKFLIDNPMWTEEMYDVLTVTSSSEYEQVFDYGYGISSMFSDDNMYVDGGRSTITILYEFVSKTDDSGKQYTWAELRSSYSNTVEEELKKINQTIDEMQS